MKTLLSCLIFLFFSIDTTSASLSDEQTKLRYRGEAWGIAVQNLFFNSIPVDDPSAPTGERFCLLAGGTHYRTLWARDFATAVPGALVGGFRQQVSDTLEVLFQYQRSDGLFPRTVDNIPIERRVILGLLGTTLPYEQPLKGWYLTEYNSITIDQNVLVPWAAGEYVAVIKDREFAKRYFAAAEKALAFVEKDYVEDNLITKQPRFSDWQDSIARIGRVALINIYYKLALDRMSGWAKFLKDDKKAAQYAERAEKVKAAFEAYFWWPERKIIRNFEGNDTIAADANLMAVVHRMVSTDKAVQIMATLRASPLWKPMPGRATYPEYDDKLKGRNLKLAGISDYFDKMHWVWITALGARAERALGNCDQYHTIIDWVSKRIANDGDIYEVYDLLKDGETLKPVNRPLYHSEHPFSWSSGMYLEATAIGCNKPFSSKKKVIIIPGN